MLEIARCAADFDMGSKDREMIHVSRQSKKGTRANLEKYAQKMEFQMKRLGTNSMDQVQMKELGKTMSIFGNEFEKMVALGNTLGFFLKSGNGYRLSSGGF